MLICFTICSNNYLAQAKIVSTSFLKYHPEAVFKIYLADHFSVNINYEEYKPALLHQVNEIISEADMLELSYRFNITELNTAVKPDIFIDLFKHYPDAKIIYLDPDIEVFSRFDELVYLLDSYAMVLTPHILKPIDDGLAPGDKELLPTGIFNLGFLALAKPNIVQEFLSWWRQRVIQYGYRKDWVGLFYDQVWLNYVPVFYDFFYILKHPGYNMANWNLHERFLDKQNENLLVNQSYPLRFFHYSGYRYSNPDKLNEYHTRYSFINRPDIAVLFDSYRKQIEINGQNRLVSIPCFYVEQKKILLKKKNDKLIAPRLFIRKVRSRLAAFIKPQ